MTETVPRTALQPGLNVLPAKGTTTAVVVVLHGGKSVSLAPSMPRHLSSVRMIPFANSLHRAFGKQGVAVWRVKYRVRGWNGAQQSPVQDARWALDEVRRQHGDVPVVLVGHSMGGRAAVHVLDDPSVVGMMALAPWLPDRATSAGAKGKRIMVAHGTTDRWTVPADSLEWAHRAERTAAELVYVHVGKTGHFMLRRARFWRALTVAWVGHTLPDGVLSHTDRHDEPRNRVAANVMQQVRLGETELTV